jgi:hypothetical protein
MQVAETFSMALDEGMRAELASRGVELPAARAGAAGASAGADAGAGGGGKGVLSLSDFARLDT